MKNLTCKGYIQESSDGKKASFYAIIQLTEEKLIYECPNVEFNGVFGKKDSWRISTKTEKEIKQLAGYIGIYPIHLKVTR